MNESNVNSESNLSFQKKVLITTKILAFTIIILLVVKTTFSVFLLILAGTLVALLFRGWSDLIMRLTKWKDSVCIAISILSIMLIVLGLFFLIGAKVQGQIAELSDTMPENIENFRAKLNESSIGETVVDRLSSNSTLDKVREFAGKFFQSTFGIFGDVYVILFIGIFFAISPKTYINGIVILVPTKKQDKANQVLNKLGEQLRDWLKGKLFSMLVVFILTAIGLAIIGVPLWLVLALLAGLISFIPNFGPLIALIPAVLVGLMQSPLTAALVAGLYILIQFIESNFITTLIQKKLINMPPALIIIAQLLMGVLTGGWGLVLATPLTVIVIVLVQELYLKNRKS